MKTDYVEIIFGKNGVIEIKKFLVEELKEELSKWNISPEQLDSIVGLNQDWPRTSQILEGPELLTHAFLQEIPETCDVTISGRLLSPAINLYLDRPGVVDEVLKEFQAYATKIRVANLPDDLGEVTRKIVEGERVKWGEINSIKPRGYVSMYILGQVLRQLDTVPIIA